MFGVIKFLDAPLLMSPYDPKALKYWFINSKHTHSIVLAFVEFLFHVVSIPRSHYYLALLVYSLMMLPHTCCCRVLYNCLNPLPQVFIALNNIT